MNISTSLICCDLANIKQDIDTIIKHENFNWLHADFMDGHFVPRYGISPELIQCIRKTYGNSVIIDSHLMVADPYSYADVIAPYSDWFIFHYEAVTDPMRTLQMLRKKYPELKIGLAFNVLTPIEITTAVIKSAYDLGYIDGVMFMGISPGVLGTNSFPINVNKKILETHYNYPKLYIFIDGSVKFNTVGTYANSGATVCVSGSSMMFKNDENTKMLNRTELINYNINRIKEAINE